MPFRVTDLISRKERGEKITMLTAYDSTMARLLDRAGVDVLLVGDSVGMVVLGYDSTIPVTIDMMIHHTRAVSRGTSRALVLADMPFLSYQVSVEEAVRNAGRLIQEGGAAAVKVEGAGPVLKVVERLTQVGIPVIGHLGLQPQSVHKYGGYRRQATSDEEGAQLAEDASALQDAGAFGLVLEMIPDAVAATVTRDLRIPTIGIGAGPYCDGQVLVSYDALGIYDGKVPSFVKQYANLGDEITKATAAYVDEVRSGKFPRRPAREEASA